MSAKAAYAYDRGITGKGVKPGETLTMHRYAKATRHVWVEPKTGTIVPAEDLPRVINESRLGRVEFRVDKTSNIHVPIGKVSFEVPALVANLRAVLEELEKAKPASAKGRYFKKVSLSSTMGPGVKLDPQRMLVVEEV